MSLNSMIYYLLLHIKLKLHISVPSSIDILSTLYIHNSFKVFAVCRNCVYDVHCRILTL